MAINPKRADKLSRRILQCKLKASIRNKEHGGNTVVCIIESMPSFTVAEHDYSLYSGFISEKLVREHEGLDVPRFEIID